MSNKNKIDEATSAGISSGQFRVPLSPGMKLWNDVNLQPYNIPVSEYDSAELAYDSYDGKMSTPKKEIKNKEMIARKIEKKLKDNPYMSDDDGDILNKNVTEQINEDLAVWFGTKKKPKGSSQPKGPWVNICRKDKNGKHPPCGRDKAESRAYPKCRGVHAAAKMSDSQKRAACAQKRRAEKTNPKSGTGNKPKMVSHKKKKKNESIDETIKLILREYVKKNL
jgi:hypothetical protein